MIKPNDHVLVTDQILDVASAYSVVKNSVINAEDPGAVVVFVGLVREFDNHLSSGRLQILRLQHYPELTEASIAEVIGQARERWVLGTVLVQHRVGDLRPADEIVVVAVTSKHRAQAFEAARFLMDKLKTEVMLWKRVLNTDEAQWVAFKDSDAKASSAW
ncbi:MAG: molybdenum cofactor biosynthesis protein MoaE [Aequoribacter sp.]|uniref:molybdenum cofactor biosynthesis protein MoaE n=1 Tax=Aequoribacter sp. TaxID=2847771 RepID=UPI003C5B18E9